MKSLQFRLSAAMLVAALSLSAQVQSGTISGVVTDQQDAVISGAQVEIKNTGTNAVFRTQTNDSGNYVFVNLDPGIYRVEGSSTGAAPCDGWAYIKINGPFVLTTVAGGAAAVLTVAGIAGMASATRPAKGGRAGRGHRWRGSLFGLLGGIGAAVLLQQAGIVPMTPQMMVGVPVGTAMVGLALGWPQLFGKAAVAAA